MRPREPLLDRARGKWYGILPSLGVPSHLLNTRKHQPCPWCGGKDRFRFTDKNGDGRFFCNQCGTGTGVDFVMRFRGWDFVEAAKEIEAVMGGVPLRAVKAKGSDPRARTAMQKLWEACSPLEPGDFVDRYLAARGIQQQSYSRWLRKIESAKHETEDGRKSWHPAMVAKILAPDGRPTNLHRTYLTLTGKKAAVEPNRKTMWGEIAPGSAIRLFDAGPVLGVAEGIETAFSAAELFRVPVWSTINSTLLSGWQPPEGVQQVIIFGDNDPKFGGQAAATPLAHRLACNTNRQISVRIEIPPAAGEDWNNVLLAKRRAAA